MIEEGVQLFAHSPRLETKVGDGNCEVIVDRRSINALSSKVIERFGLKTIPHP